MRRQKKGNKRSKTRAERNRAAFCPLSAEGQEAADGRNASTEKETKGKEFHRCLEMTLPDGKVLRALAVEHCSDPALIIQVQGDGEHETVCSIQYNPDHPRMQRLRVAAFQHDCDFPCYEGPFVAKENGDGM